MANTSMSIFLVHNTFIMLAKYKGVHFSLVVVDVTLEKMHTIIRRGTITEYDINASRYNST